MDKYIITFRFPYEEKFSREHDWPDDRTAISRARNELEQFVGPAPGQQSGSVSVRRLSGREQFEVVQLGVWDFNPTAGYEWVPKDCTTGLTAREGFRAAAAQAGRREPEQD